MKQKQSCNKFSKDFKNDPHQKKKKILSCDPEQGTWLALEFKT